jgi:hypothetical protein
MNWKPYDKSNRNKTVLPKYKETNIFHFGIGQIILGGSEGFVYDPIFNLEGMKLSRNYRLH